jgi:hypothetical protein
VLADFFHLPCRYVEDERLNAKKAREIWPGLESVPWAALSEE